MRMKLTDRQLAAVTAHRQSLDMLAKAHQECKTEISGMLKYFRVELGFPLDVPFDLSADGTELVEVQQEKN